MGVTETNVEEIPEHLRAFRRHIKNGQVTDEMVARIYKSFEDGRLDHSTYKRLSHQMQTLYRAAHGYRPASDAEAVGIRRTEQKKKAKKRAEKKARKQSRGS